MTTDGESWRLSATELSTLIASRQISAVKVAEEALERLEATNPAINAIVEYRPNEIIQRAEEIDAKLDRGEHVGRLAGVPVTIKVLTDQAGYASTNGLKSQADLIAETNNPVVQSFIDAGAVPLGRTNTPAFSYRWFTSNLLHGHTYNPRNKTITPGGSSGGAGSSVAAGIGAIAHGTDIAGSVRYPAYACGVHGLRPSLGRVAGWNASGPERNIGAQLMSVSGPLARTVSDVKLAFEVMTRPDARDPWWHAGPLTGSPIPKHAALCLYPDGLETAPELVDALLKAADKLRDAGWIVDEVASLPPLKKAVSIQKTLWFGDNFASLLEAAQKEEDPGALCLLEGNRDFAAALGEDAVSKALTQRATVIREWKLFLEHYPLVLLPPCGELPFADDLDLTDLERVWIAQMSMIALPVTGLPCMTVTTNILDDGIPVGVQLISNSFREDVCLEAAADIEARSETLPIAEP